MIKKIEELVSFSKKSIRLLDCLIQAGVENMLHQFKHQLIGLHEIKKKIEEIISLVFLDQIRESKNLSVLSSSLHMSFTGRSGVGKSLVGQKITEMFRDLGLLKTGIHVVATRNDLVGQYVGHTAPKTREVLQNAHGGVLMIDQAYELYKPDNERDYGPEAIELLLQVMENQRKDLIIIFAGDKKKIENFFHANSGVSSRIGNHFHFSDYNVNELTKITESLLLHEFRYTIHPEALEIVAFYLKQLVHFPTFANARTIKLLLYQIFAYQAIRIQKMLKKEKQLTFQTLKKIEPEDFFALKKEQFQSIIGSSSIELFP